MISDLARREIIEWQDSDPDGWFHRGDEDYARLLETLVNKGFTEEEGLDLLGRAYSVASNEFGC
jgi:hypothetical protein